jgi:dTDP-glucose pyrophosphorylase
MEDFKQNIIPDTYSIRETLARLDIIGVQGNVLFIVNLKGQLLGTITDGDIRRGLLKEFEVTSSIISIANLNFSYIEQSNEIDILEKIKYFKTQRIKFIPLINEKRELIKIINIDNYKGFLPIDVFIMAGGKGSRLMPLTKDCPKPMLKIGDKPIIEHNIDRLISYGVSNFTISINYLGNIIEDHFGDGSSKGISINYVQEEEPLGTLGSISLVPDFKNEHILVMNSDLLTDIDYLDFFESFKSSIANLSVASIPYNVNVPYAVLELNEKNHIQALKEKPKYTYYSNAGIYLIEKECLNLVPHNKFYNATDLIEQLINDGKIVSSFPILGYWLDIGKMPDYLKAQVDIKHLKI